MPTCMQLMAGKEFGVRILHEFESKCTSLSSSCPVNTTTPFYTIITNDWTGHLQQTHGLSAEASVIFKVPDPA